MRDLSERKHAEQELRRLHARLETVRTEESRRMARRVHDDVGQSLTALQIELASLRREAGVAGEDLQARVDAASRLVGETIETVRGIAQELHPRILDDLGLAAALRADARRIEERANLVCGVEVSPQDFTLDRTRSEALYRVYREAVTNVLRHARATSVRVRLRQTADQVELVVADDGCGMPPRDEARPQSLGLSSMRESMRALGGECGVTSTPGRGTIVTARIPDADGSAADLPHRE